MSHFPVLVVLKDGDEDLLNKALQPYHEFECTGTNDEFVQDIDKTDEYRKEYETMREEGQDFAAWIEGWSGHKVVPFGQEPDINGEHKYGYTLVDEKGDVVRSVDRTNPNKTWDWWVIGGRWPGKLIRRDGTGVNNCFKRDLNLNAMRERACKHRRESVVAAYDKVRANQDLRNSEITALWDEFRNLVIEGTTRWEAMENRGPKWDHLRENPRIRELETLGIMAIGPWSYFDGADVPETEPDPLAWADKAPALSVFAVITEDGQWHEKGRMGWWAAVHDEKADWPEQFQAIFDAIPDERYLVIVDCHI